MRTAHLLSARVPLLPRVVFLYVLIGLPIFAAQALHTTPSVPTEHFALEIAHNGFSQLRQATVKGVPIRIQIKRLGIDLPIVAGTYDAAKDSWTLTRDKAQFATATTEPNDSQGNTLIYGHNTKPVFKALSGLQPDDLAVITVDTEHTFTYRFTGDMTVTPHTTSILDFSPEKPRLTVMTCDGLWNQVRRVMFFDLQEVT